jgi:hypothetical protein
MLYIHTEGEDMSTETSQQRQKIFCEGFSTLYRLPSHISTAHEHNIAKPRIAGGESKVMVKWSRPNRVKLNGALSLSYSIPKLYFLVHNHAVYRANHVVGHTLDDWVLWQIRVV